RRPRVPELDRGDHEALLVDARRAARHRAGDDAADVVVVAEGLDEGDDLLVAGLRRGVEDRDGDAEVREVADAPFGLVDVVVEEDIAGDHRLQREVPGHRVDQGAVGPSGELAHEPVVDAGAEVVGVPDHRRAGGPRDRRLDLHLDGGQAALDDLDEDRVGTRPGVGGQGVERELGGGKPRGGHESAPSRVTMMLRYSSMRTTNPGWTGTVESNSSMMVGPASRVP